jgi:hypothetical protein
VRSWYILGVGRASFGLANQCESGSDPEPITILEREVDAWIAARK